MRAPLRAAIAVVGVVLACAGCRLPAASPVPRYWVLAPIAGTPPDEAPQHLVGVGPFELPAYLDRRALVSRSSESELRVAELDAWGEDLKRGFPQTLARNLEILLPGVGAAVFPWRGPHPMDHQVSGIVTAFEVVEGRSAHLELTWTVTRLSDSRWVGGGSWRGEAPVEGDGVAAEVAALSRVLGDYSREVARVLVRAE